MELSNSNIKKSYYISRNGTLHFLRPSPKKNQKNSPRKKFLIFQEMELSCSNVKKFLYLQEWNPSLPSPITNPSKIKKNPP